MAKRVTLTKKDGEKVYPRTYTKLVQNGDGEILDNIMLTSAKILPFSGYEVGLNDAAPEAIAPSGYTINYHRGRNMFFAVVDNVNYSNWGNAEQLLYNRGYSAREDNVYIQSNGNICVIKNGSMATVSAVGTHAGVLQEKFTELEEEQEAFKQEMTSAQEAFESAINSNVDSFKSAVTDQVNNYKPIEITGDVTNAPDEEDLTSDENNLLKLKNRSALNGMGRIILRMGKTFAEQLTQTNTIYEIRYDFDLEGESINIPSNCILRFEGGLLKNGTIICNNTYINSELYCFDCNIEGTILNEYINVVWLGIFPNDSNIDATILINKVLKLSSKIQLNFLAGNYYFSEWHITTNQLSIIGVKDSALNPSTIFNPYSDSQYYIIKIGGTNKYEFQQGSSVMCKGIRIENINFCTPQGFTPKDLNSSSFNCPYRNGALVLDYVGNGYFNISGSGIHNTPFLLLGYFYECVFESIIMYGNHGKSDLPIIEIQNNISSTPESASIIKRLWVEVFVGPIIYMGNRTNLGELQIDNIFIEGTISWEGESINSENRFEGENKKTFPDYYLNESLNIIPMFKLSGGNVVINNIMINSTDTEWKNSLDDNDNWTTRALFDLTNFNIGCFHIYNIVNSALSKHMYIPRDTNYKNVYGAYLCIENSFNVIFYNYSKVPLISKILKPKFSICDITHNVYEKEELLDIIAPAFIENVGNIPEITNTYNDNCFIATPAFRDINIYGFKTEYDFMKITYRVNSITLQDIFKISYYDSSDILITTQIENFYTDNTKSTRIIKLNKPSNYAYFKIQSAIEGYIVNIYKLEFFKNPNEAIFYSTRPTSLTSNMKGFNMFDETLGSPIWWNGTAWVDATSVIAGTSTVGTFANKPTVSANSIPVGFRYFCTDKQTTEGATDGIEIIYKGQDTTVPDNPIDIWVDALGRVVE